MFSVQVLKDITVNCRRLWDVTKSEISDTQQNQHPFSRSVLVTNLRPFPIYAFVHVRDRKGQVWWLWRISVLQLHNAGIYKILRITRKSEKTWHVWAYGFPLCFCYTSLHKIPLGPIPPEAAINNSSTYKTNGVFNNTPIWWSYLCKKHHAQLTHY